MIKTVAFEFPDDFKFPKYFMQENIKKTHTQELKYHRIITTWDDSSCRDCPFRMCDEDYEYCMITSDDECTDPSKRHKCPFYRGQEAAVYRNGK